MCNESCYVHFLQKRKNKKGLWFSFNKYITKQNKITINKKCSECFRPSSWVKLFYFSRCDVGSILPVCPQQPWTHDALETTNFKNNKRKLQNKSDPLALYVQRAITTTQIWKINPTHLLYMYKEQLPNSI